MFNSAYAVAGSVEFPGDVTYFPFTYQTGIFDVASWGQYFLLNVSNEYPVLFSAWDTWGAVYILVLTEGVTWTPF